MIPDKFEPLPELLSRADEACKTAHDLQQQLRETLARAVTYNSEMVERHAERP